MRQVLVARSMTVAILLAATCWTADRLCAQGSFLGNQFAGPQPEEPHPGERLFTHQWQAADPLSPNGDGLGPLHNANSCVACHFQGGVGGAGDLEHNVDLISVDVPAKGRLATSGRFARHVHENVHPGFAVFQPHIVLHAASTQEGYELVRYRTMGFAIQEDMTEAQRKRLIAAVNRRASRDRPVVQYKAEGVALTWSQRQTPALFGVGLIDEIPRELLERIADDQPKQHPGVSGRLAGRFGWRGQTETLHEFVLGACANELGLQCGDHNQAADPQRPDYQPPGDDLSEDQQELLISYVASLPAPEEAPAFTAAAKAELQSGKNLFASIGCAACHVPDVGNAIGIYSDLLLHDMGAGLSDPLPAPPQMQVTGQEITPSFGYFGHMSHDVFTAVPTNTTQEWRTPPLWGCAATAPYLHDGRAATIDAAIRLHGGEGESSARRYAALDGASQRRLTGFLNMLGQPFVDLEIEVR